MTITKHDLALAVDNDRLARNSFTGPSLPGVTTQEPVLANYTPPSLGEGTFREVLMSQDPSVASATKGLQMASAIAGISIPDTVTNSLTVKVGQTTKLLRTVFDLPQVGLLQNIVLSTDWFAGDTLERSIWLKHFLAIMQTESNFQDESVIWNRNSAVSYAKVKPSTLEVDEGILNDSPDYRDFLLTTYFKRMMQIFKLDPSIFSVTSGFQAIPGSVIAVPTIHFMSISDQFKDRFLWTGKHWTPILTVDRISELWKAMSSQGYMKSYYLGRQACLTLMHIDPMFARRNTSTTKDTMNKVLQTLINFLAFTEATYGGTDERMGDVIVEPESVKTIRGWNPSGKGRHKHLGYDLQAKTGTPIYSVSSGVVLSAAWTHPDHKKSWGRAIVILSPKNISIRYAHLRSFNVAQSQKVKAGDLIGYSDNSGRSEGPHLHIEYLKGGRQVDPRQFNGTDLDMKYSLIPKRK